MTRLSVGLALATELDVPWAASYEELLDATDAVAIVTPTGLHAGRPVAP